MTVTGFHICDASASRRDGEFILAALDAAIPHLNATGSAAQWGSEPMSSDAARVEAIHKAVDEAETYRRTGEGSAVEVRVAEVDGVEEVPAHAGDGGRLKVAAICVRDAWWPWYITKMEHLGPKIEHEDSWAYLHILISDYRAGERRKGAGAALIAEARARAKDRGVRRMYVDCWAGNGRKLVG